MHAKKTYYKLLADKKWPKWGKVPVYHTPRGFMPGEWMPRVKGQIVPCENGYHVLELKDLPYWLLSYSWDTVKTKRDYSAEYVSTISLYECEFLPRGRRVTDESKTVGSTIRLTKLVGHMSLQRQKELRRSYQKRGLGPEHAYPERYLKKLLKEFTK